MGDADKVEELLRGGADINEQNEREQTALHIAIQRSEVEIVRILTRNDAELEAKDQAGNTPLLALSNNNWSNNLTHIARRLLDTGVQIEVRAENDSTSLHRASTACLLKLVELFLLHGADVNSTKGPDQLTPLHPTRSASNIEKTPVMQCLLGAQANIHAILLD
jgi:ankyrin repeat protein